MQQKLTCGTAKKDITPPEELLNGVYGLFGVVYTGIIDPLFLRVIALSDGDNRALIISFDLDKAPNPVAWLPEIAERTGFPEKNILYIGTHTHSAPVITNRPKERHTSNISERMKSSTKKYEDLVHEKLFEALDDALSSMRPAQMGYAKGESYINVNRSAEYHYEAQDGKVYPFVTQGPNNAAPVDRTVFVMKVDDEGGNPMAFFVNYAVHCCTMFLNHYDAEGSMGISGDIAGTVSRYIEDRFSGSVAVWSSGAAGDVNPIIANEVFYPNPKDGSRQVYLFPDYKTINALMISLAARHFADILTVVRSIDNYSGSMRIEGAVEWSETETFNISSVSDSEKKTDGDSDKAYRIRLHLLRLGEVALMGIGGELFSSFGQMIREASPMANTVIINHEASLINDAGYVMDDATLERVRRKSPMKGGLPGGACEIKSGQIASSLMKHSASLFRKVL